MSHNQAAHNQAVHNQVSPSSLPPSTAASATNQTAAPSPQYGQPAAAAAHYAQGTIPGATLFNPQHHAQTPYAYPARTTQVPPTVATPDPNQLAHMMHAFMASQGTPLSVPATSTPQSSLGQPTPVSSPPIATQYSPIHPQQPFHQPSPPSQASPAAPTATNMFDEPPVMRISGDLPIGTQMLWCDGMYCGWGNHTSARHEEAMKLQETHPDSGPNYTKKDGAFNPAALIFLCLRLSGPSRVPRVPRGEVLAVGVFGVAESISGLFLCGFGVFRVRAIVGTWLSRSACPRCPPFSPMVPCTRRARRARRARLFFGSEVVPGDGCSSGAFCVFCRVLF